MPFLELPLDTVIALPEPIVHRRVEDKHLFIAVANPCWISTGEVGAYLLLAFREGRSIGESCRLVSSLLGLGLEHVVGEARTLLAEIMRHGFRPKSEPSPALRTATLHLYLTRRCNMRCPYCYMESGPDLSAASELTSREWCELIERFAKFADADPRINYSGGEPMLRPDLLEIAGRAKQLGFYNKMFTNGVLISERNVDRICDVFDSVQITLDGATADAHERTRATGSFARITRALDLLAARDVQVDIAVSAFPENILDLQTNLVPYLHSLAPNRHSVYLSYDLFLLGRGADVYDSEYEDFFSNRANALISGILEHLEHNGFKSNVYFEMNLMLDNCGIGTTIGVDANGDIYPCSMPYLPQGNARSHDLIEVARSIQDLARSTTVDRILECADCDLKNVCLGGCRMSNKIKYGDFLTPGCSEERRRKKYRQMADMMPINMEK